MVHAKPASSAPATPIPPEAAAPDATSTGQPSNLPEVLGYAGVAVGAVLLVAGAVEIAKWASDKNTADAQRAMVPATVSDVCAAPGFPTAAAACQTSTREMNDAVFAWALTAAGVAVAGTGVWLLIASGSSDSKPAAARLPFEIVPVIGLQTRSLDLRLRF